MGAQTDFVAMITSAVTISASTSETVICQYTAPAAEDVDCILQSFSHGTPASSPKKAVWRVYTGADACTGTSAESTMPAQVGAVDPGDMGTFTRGGTAGASKGQMVFRETLNQQSGYTNPQVIRVARGTRLLVTCQFLASDTNDQFARLAFRKPGLSG